MNLPGLIKAFRTPVLGTLLALVLCSGVLSFLGESPWVLAESLRNTLFTQFGIGYTIFYSTPLIFTGLAVALSFHCGLFNIGGEGQLYIGSMAIVAFATLFAFVPWPIALPLGVLAAMVAAGIWGGIAGWLRARYGSHEVIVTILLNFIGLNLVNYLVLYPYRNPESQNAETLTISSSYQLPYLSTLLESVGLPLLKSTPANLAFLLALVAAVAVYVFLFYTPLGFEFRASGTNPTAARFAGIRVTRNQVLALTFGGALAGLVGVNEVMGHQHRLIEGFSPGYGFTGIAVALLARNHPLAIILTAFLFGSLHNSARELEFVSEKVTKELSMVLQGLIIAIIAAEPLWDQLFAKLVKKRKAKES